ncbi:MAG: hypothetical protein HUK22_04735, partial [Thermoguttaceae bacterium]|nr:hypothetical protein [Thermoguttaceae bacterium]
ALDGTIAAQNVAFAENSANYDGGAAYLVGADEAFAAFEGAIFTANEASNGGAVRIYGMRTELRDCAFADSTASAAGGAVYIDDDADVLIEGASFVGNVSSEDGGAIYNEGRLVANGVRFEVNDATRRGGALYTSGSLELRDGNFEGGAAAEGGAIYVDANIAGAESWVLRSNFEGGEAEYGGAVYNAANLTVVQSTFAQNAAQFGGGAIYNENALFVEDSSFSENVATRVGGAIVNERGAVLAATNSSFFGNVAQLENGGAVANHGEANFSGLVFRDNAALEGFGGAIFNDETLTIQNSTVAANNALNGAGLHNALNGTAVATGVLFWQNAATEKGGAAYCVGPTTFNSSYLAKNVARLAADAAFYTDPNAISAPTVDSLTVVTDNVAATVPTAPDNDTLAVFIDGELGAEMDFGALALNGSTPTKTITIFNPSSQTIQLTSQTTIRGGTDATSVWKTTAKRQDGTAITSLYRFEIAPGETIT